MSSLEDDSDAPEADQVADGGGAWGVKGEKAEEIGDSAVYLQVAFRSLGLDELGLASAGIQLLMP